MHEAHASSAEAEASFSAPSAPSDAPAAPDFLRFEPPVELIETAPLVSSSLGSSLGRTRRLRRDGWTAAARRAFLERLAETGVVLDACLAAGMSAQAAYALAARDPLFDAGWNAALLFARRRLADELLARAMNGVVEQVHKDGVVVFERHRHDNKLAVAMLARMDARLDRAEERGERHLEVARRWEDYLDAVGEDRREDGLALLAAPEPAPGEDSKNPSGHQLHQLKDDEAAEEEEEDPHSVWADRYGTMWTDYPPPEGFEGTERATYGNANYRRSLTEAEAAAVEAEEDAEYAAAEAQRDRYFGLKPPEASEADTQ